MKLIILCLFIAAIAFSGCSAYKSAQTPDDIYYSTGKSASAAASTTNNNSEYYSTAASDQYVRMRVSDPARWSYFDDYSAYGSSPVGYGGGFYDMGSYGYGFGSPWLTFGYWSPFTYWNSYYAWNSFYNPYYGNIVVVNPKLPSYSTYAHLRPFSAASYANGNYNGGSGTRISAFSPYTQPSRSTGTSSSSYRRFSNGSNYNNNYYHPSSQPVRSFSPSSFNGGSSGGGGMRGGGGVGRH